MKEWIGLPLYQKFKNESRRHHDQSLRGWPEIEFSSESVSINSQNLSLCFGLALPGKGSTPTLNCHS